jgi:hypothetical protein
VNEAEKQRDARIRGLDDVDALALLLDHEDDEHISERERVVFEEMRGKLDRGDVSCLSKAQRSWVDDVLRRVVPLDSRLIPKGRPVVTPPVLLNLPKKPPGRR